MEQANENILSEIDPRNEGVDDGNEKNCGDGHGKRIENYSKLAEVMEHRDVVSLHLHK